ncbi:Membrane transporter [Micractinium conductrix]|uniref:Glycerophosphocholine acyltransferase 1 n=1 Tax=Micractinium conductrix TaxID=554055 RepID=A0A2P6VG96_9CHLO|nr:Membrane transporter [Micractinium conductrix]|eukprot:PSC73097.1 Membrane transporter [Micractinium conductrix]
MAGLQVAPAAAPTPPQPANPARMLGRQPTLRDRLDSVGHDLQHRLEPLLSAADIAVGEMANFLDTPAAVEEALSEQRPLEVPPSPAAAAGPPSGAEARQAAAAEAQLVRAAGVWVDPQKIMLQDKLAFVLGVCNVVVTAFWVGRWPETYHHFWLLKDVLLFSLRFLVYRKSGMHYMMFEYCYFGNALGLYHLFLRPDSAFLRRFAFAVMSGPLMWSIIAMRNSLVFHDGDKLTTLMMHASPALSAWCMRWHPQPEWTAGMQAAQLAEWNSATWLQMAVVPAALNVGWAVAYFLLIFVFFNKRIQERGYQNMFTAMVTRPSARKSALARLVLSAPRRLQPVTYLAMHTFASWLSLLPTKIWFDHYWAHTAITAAVLLVSVWNGASFYFRVFARKMMREQAQREAAAADGKKAA